MSERLPAALEVGALCRRAEGEGGFAAVLRKGDAERGSIIVFVAEKGQIQAILERKLAPDFRYRWASTDCLDEAESSRARAERMASDPDSWLIELDIADAERFVAEMTSMG